MNSLLAFGEKRKGDEIDEGPVKFQFNAREMFLTYSRTDGEREDLYDHLLQCLKIQPEQYLICKEDHKEKSKLRTEEERAQFAEDEVVGTHFHVLLRFSKRFCFRDPRRFDWGDHHPKIETVKNYNAAIRYLLKEDKNVLCNFDYAAVLEEAAKKKKIKYFKSEEWSSMIVDGDIKEEGDVFELMKSKCIKTKDYETVLQELRTFKNAVARNTQEKRTKVGILRDTRPWVLEEHRMQDIEILFDKSEVPLEDTRAYPALYWIFGPTGTGKTVLAQTITDKETGETIPYFNAPRMNNDWSSYKNEQVVIFSEGSADPTTLINLTESGLINRKYEKSTNMPKDVIFFITVNFTPEEYYAKMLSKEGRNSGDDAHWTAFLTRIQPVKINERNPKVPEGRRPTIESGLPAVPRQEEDQTSYPAWFHLKRLGQLSESERYLVASFVSLEASQFIKEPAYKNEVVYGFIHQHPRKAPVRDRT